MLQWSNVFCVSVCHELSHWKNLKNCARETFGLSRGYWKTNGWKSDGISLDHITPPNSFVIQLSRNSQTSACQRREVFLIVLEQTTNSLKLQFSEDGGDWQISRQNDVTCTHCRCQHTNGSQTAVRSTLHSCSCCSRLWWRLPLLLTVRQCSDDDDVNSANFINNSRQRHQVLMRSPTEERIKMLTGAADLILVSQPPQHSADGIHSARSEGFHDALNVEAGWLDTWNDELRRKNNVFNRTCRTGGCTNVTVKMSERSLSCNVPEILSYVWDGAKIHTKHVFKCLDDYRLVAEFLSWTVSSDFRTMFELQSL